MKSNTDTKCNMVQQYIINLIKERNLSEGDHLPTSEKLCKELGVSRVTVQNAYSVLQSAGVLYRKRGGGTFASERPFEKSSEALSILPFIIYNNDPTNAAVLKMIRGAEDYLCDKDYYVTVHSPYCDTQKETKIIDSLINSGIKSMIVFPHDSNYNRNFYFNLIQKWIKIVFVDILPNDINGNLVCSDNISGGYYAAKHLLEKGYTHIGFISQALTEYTTISEHFKGYQYAHNEAGIEPDS